MTLHIIKPEENKKEFELVRKLRLEQDKNEDIGENDKYDLLYIM